ncbi:TetR/AcrR family transcriptional regulator [Nocardiopsis suaedae]|uniref:Helix-turn-helix domain containing protein n=1 Tax=Nocardiopsis suaedae TaxID=3018444 RepID=A0ABT4TJL9_9ACTN|nr:TetR/AcrR family transcriptional regulator [Nocardiopsis suaedae]MDA2804878.1 helix-turn-helix domain containing protein [Nocardiopsis suaedae]
MGGTDERTRTRTGAARRLPRAQRRDQILDAAASAFARSGYAATGLDEVAAEAGITRVLLYRHFESKNALYRAVLDRSSERLAGRAGTEGFDDTTLPALLRAAASDPDGFRLLFRHAAREPEFRDVVDSLAAASTAATRAGLAGRLPEGAWNEWACRLVPVVAIEAVIAWLDAGGPDPETAHLRVEAAVHGVIAAAAPRPD